jgi:hypothetical protein
MNDIPYRHTRRHFLAGSAAFAIIPATAPAPSTRPVRNVRVTGSADGTTAHIQPTIAVSPHDPRKLFGVCFAWLDGWNHRNELALYTTSDAGRSWTVGELPGSVALNDHGATYGPDGVGYVWADNGLPHVWRTDDDGRTFEGPVLAWQEARIDRAILAVDSLRPRNLYGVWGTDDNESVGFARSTDGGRTFTGARRIAHGQGEGAEWTVAPEVAGRDGVVHATYGIWPRQ